jgi:hypothetical protein
MLKLQAGSLRQNVSINALTYHCRRIVNIESGVSAGRHSVAQYQENRFFFLTSLHGLIYSR